MNCLEIREKFWNSIIVTAFEYCPSFCVLTVMWFEFCNTDVQPGPQETSEVFATPKVIDNNKLMYALNSFLFLKFCSYSCEI